MPLTVLLPAAGTPDDAPVVYLLHGGYSGHAEWAERMDLAGMLAPYPLAAVLPEGGASMYVRTHGGEDFERCVVRDVPEFIEAQLPVSRESSRRGIAGISMGGFGACNLALRHPGRYAVAGALSGAFGMTWWQLGLREDAPFHTALGPPGSATRETFNPFNVLEAALRGGAEAPPFYLAVGCSDDPDVVEANRAYRGALARGGVPQAYTEAAGGHTWDFWRAQTPALLAFLAAELGCVEKTNAPAGEAEAVDTGRKILDGGVG